MVDIMPCSHAAMYPCSPGPFFSDNASVFHVVLVVVDGGAWPGPACECIHALRDILSPLRNTNIQNEEKIREQIETSFCHANAIQFYFSTIGLWAVPGK